MVGVIFWRTVGSVELSLNLLKQSMFNNQSRIKFLLNSILILLYEKLHLLNSSISERNEAKVVPLIISAKLRGLWILSVA